MAARGKPLKGYKRLPGHKYRTPRGKVITEYEYRSRKARRAGFSNYTRQRRFRERQDFQKLRFDVLSTVPEADVAVGGELEAGIVAEIRLRERERAGRPARPGTGPILEGAEEGDRISQILALLGQQDWWKWRFWYSEVAVR